MARLQDFQTVTPTDSDKMLVIQSQGQGLAPWNTKLNSANPTGTGSLSMNRMANTNTGNYSTTEGYNNEASGNYSHAEGQYNVASGITSHAEGVGTVANHRSQHVFGDYNVADPSTAAASSKGNYIEIVGNGTSTTPSNARTLDWYGNEVLAGRLSINGDRPVSTILSFNKSTSTQGINDKALWDEVFGEIPNEYYGLIKIYFKSSYSVTAMANKASSNWGSILAIANGDYNPYFYTYANGTTTLHRLAYTS